MPGEHDSQLAGELRATEWAMDDLANDLPAGRATAEQLNELADRLSGMAAVLRVRAGGNRSIHGALERP